MEKKLLVLFILFILITASPAYASNMGFKKVFVDPSSSSGYTLEDIDKTTDHILDKNVLLLNRMTDLIIKSSDLFGHSNTGRDITFQQHMAQMNMQFLALQNTQGYFIGSAEKTNNNTFQSVQIINNDFNGLLVADVNGDFTGLLLGDVNGDAADARVIVRQYTNGIAQIGLGVVGATNFTRTITYTYDAFGNETWSYDTAAFDSLTTNLRDEKGDFFQDINISPW